MYSVLLGIVVCGIATFLILWNCKWYNQDHKLEGSVGFAIIGAFAGMIPGFYLAQAVDSHIPRQDYVYGPVSIAPLATSDLLDGVYVLNVSNGNDKKQLVSQLQSTHILEGAYALESHGADWSKTYYFLEKDSDGNVNRVDLPNNEVLRIVEDDSLTNVGYWTTTIREPLKTSWLLPWSSPAQPETIVSQELRVPVNGVVRSFHSS